MPCFRTPGRGPAAHPCSHRDSPRTGHLHVLPIDCRPRAFSAPRRFRLHDRSENVALQPDRVRTVSDSLTALSGFELDSDHRTPCCQRHPGPTARLPDPLESAPLTGGCTADASEQHRFRRTRPTRTDGRCTARRPFRDELCGTVGRIGSCDCRLPRYTLHPSKNVTPAQRLRPSLARLPPRRWLPCHRRTPERVDVDRALDLEVLSPCGSSDPGPALPQAIEVFSFHGFLIPLQGSFTASGRRFRCSRIDRPSRMPRETRISRPPWHARNPRCGDALHSARNRSSALCEHCTGSRHSFGQRLERAREAA
jgi:hypothetical protein